MALSAAPKAKLVGKKCTRGSEIRTWPLPSHSLLRDVDGARIVMSQAQAAAQVEIHVLDADPDSVTAGMRDFEIGKQEVQRGGCRGGAASVSRVLYGDSRYRRCAAKLVLDRKTVVVVKRGRGEDAGVSGGGRAYDGIATDVGYNRRVERRVGGRLGGRLDYDGGHGCGMLSFANA